MHEKSYSFTKEYLFHGEFWADISDNKGRFSAKIEYSPYNGLILDYCISDSDSSLECKRLYGILNTGQSCTIIGDFNFTSGSVCYNNSIKVLTGRHAFRVLVFDTFHSEDDIVENCSFSLYGMQEFIHPQGLVSKIKYSDFPLLTARGSGWIIEIISSEMSRMVGDGLVNVVGCRNENALKKFTDDFKSTKDKYPDAMFLLRDTLKFYFRYTDSENKDLYCHMKNIRKIADLFSIILDKPVIPEELHVRFVGDTVNRSCLFSNYIEQRTIDLALSEVRYQMLPLNLNDFDFEIALRNWMEISDNYKSLSATYQNETGYRTLHQAHADIILYSTQLEAINQSLEGSTGTKYTTPIDTYGGDVVRKELESIFIKFNTDELGRNISNLRGELAHVGRPKNLMKVMSVDDYVNVGLFLKVVITSYLLSQLGLSEQQIKHYQMQVTQ